MSRMEEKILPILLIIGASALFACGSGISTPQLNKASPQSDYYQQLSLLQTKETSLNQAGISFQSVTPTSGSTLQDFQIQLGTPTDSTIQPSQLTQLRITRLTDFIQATEAFQSRYLYQSDLSLNGAMPQQDPVTLKLQQAKTLLAKLN